MQSPQTQIEKETQDIPAKVQKTSIREDVSGKDEIQAGESFEPIQTNLKGAKSGGTRFTAPQLHDELKMRGYMLSKSTLKRELAKAVESGILPKNLENLGVIADFALRKASNPKDSSVKWLGIKETP